jgi:hypothetical protein
MAKAKRVLSTPPTNTSLTRRNILGTIAAAAAATTIAGKPAAAGCTREAAEAVTTRARSFGPARSNKSVASPRLKRYPVDFAAEKRLTSSSC